MTRFTKEAMLDELRVVFLFEADHLLLGAGHRMAETFIGLSLDDVNDDQYCFASPALVDLSRFCVSDVLDRAYDLAFQPSVLTHFEEHEIQDLNTFILGLPRAGGTSAGGETHAFMESDGLCRTVADLAMARWRLDYSDWGGEFTTRQLALLANMSEGAVRNAIADKSENGLRTIPNSKPVAVEAKEAKRWLTGRRGFVPAPERLSNDPVAKQRLGSLQSVQEFGEFIRQCVMALRVDTQETPEIGDWIKGTFTFEAAVAQNLAERFELDVPLFVGKALEVSLRRDAAQAEVQS